MHSQSDLNQSKALDSVHGVHVLPHSPFALEEITQHGEFPQSLPCQSSGITTNQQLLMQ